MSGEFPIPYQTAIAMAEVLEIDRNLLFDEFAQCMDYPYSDRPKDVSAISNHISRNKDIKFTAYLL